MTARSTSSPARDRASGWRKLLYTLLAGGWQGTSKQWKAHNRTVLHLSGLATPLVLSVHSVVSWDFAMSIVPGWHATIFAPYFVAGAIFSGFAMVLTMMIPVRRIFGLEEYITDYHFENMSRFLLLTSTIVGYAYASEYFMAWYGGVEAEQTSFWLRAFGPYWISTWIMIVCNGVVPQIFWFKWARTHIPTIFVVATLINIGMWFERYVIIITGLSREFNTAVWGTYTPHPFELMIVAGSFSFFAVFFLIFLKLFPVIPISEVVDFVAYADVGNAFAEWEPWGINDMRGDAGLEMRLFLPVFGAPLRLIYGQTFNTRGTEDTKSFLFSIGTTF